MMKLRTFAQWAGVRYETAWRWFKAGKIKGYQLDTKTIVITEDLGQHPEREIIVVVYARVSANEHRPNLERQAERLSAYCVAKGWKVHKVVKEVGSGVNDRRKKLLAILADPTITIIVVEHKDRLTRFGFKYIETLLYVIWNTRLWYNGSNGIPLFSTMRSREAGGGSDAFMDESRCYRMVPFSFCCSQSPCQSMVDNRNLARFGPSHTRCLRPWP